MRKNFDDSISACKGVNGKLAEPKNKQINDAYATESNNVFGSGKEYWFGIRKEGGLWKYVSNGQTIPFPNWQSGQPDNDDCLYLGISGTNHVSNWWDRPCTSLHFLYVKSNSENYGLKTWL